MSTLILNSLEIRNFRAFRDLKIERLGSVNLIVGKNNVGKTSLSGFQGACKAPWWGLTFYHKFS